VVFRELRRILFPKPNPRDALLARLPRGGVGAEVGVWRGEFSRRLLETARPEKLYLIDPWEFQAEFGDCWYGGLRAKSQADMDAIHDEVRDAFGSRPDVVIARGYSVDVLGGYPDGRFDWIYIDGNHYYDPVLADLRLARAKVRPGGLITGDDYDWKPDEGFPVQRAVADFAAEAGLAVEVLGSQFLIVNAAT